MLFAAPPLTSPSSLLAMLSYLPLPKGLVEWVQGVGLSEGERKGLQRGKEFGKTGTGYQVRLYSPPPLARASHP